MSWVVVVASDIAINKYLLKLSPHAPGVPPRMLYAINPVGFGSMLISPGVSIAGSSAARPALQPYSPLVAIVLALVLPPVLAVATTGRYYLRRTDDGIDRRCSTSTATLRRGHAVPRLPRGIERPDLVALRPTTRWCARCV
jgi:hypothetical protein